MSNQFENPANFRAHDEHTAVEILEQTGGEITHVVAGMGAPGTLMGVSRRMKEYDGAIKVIKVETVLGHRVQGLKNMSGSIVPKIFEPALLNGHYVVNDDEAFNATRMLAVKEGIFCEMSSGVPCTRP